MSSISRKGARLLAVFFLGAFSSVATAANSAATLERFFDRLTSLQADFQQIVRDAQGRILQQSSGKVVLQKPGHFRWDYVKPFHQLVLADGDRLWVYDPDLRQVTVNSLNNSTGFNPAMLLSGDRPLSDTFRIQVLKKDEDGQWFELKPDGEDAGFESIRLALDGEQLRVMEFIDGFAQRTTLHFSHVRQNQIVAPDVFRFQVPAGVDVVGDVGSSQQGEREVDGDISRKVGR